MGGIILTEKGRKFCEETILKAYYNPLKREEIEEIAQILGLDLEKLKDSFLKKVLKTEEPKRVKILLITNCGECRNCDHITSMQGEYKCVKVYTDEQKIDWKIIPDWHKIPEWCPLQDADNQK